MNILIHGISTNMGGAKRHLNNMMFALGKRSDNNRYFVIVNDKYETPWESDKCKALRFPIAMSNGLKRIFFDNYYINKLIEDYEIDILISFANFGPIKAKCKHILFEMNALYFCKNIQPMLTTKQRIDYSIKRSLIRLAGNNADLIVTPSESLKILLYKSIGLDLKKIDVLHHAIEQNFNKDVEHITLAEDDKTIFLYPSHLARHKGVDVLIDALTILKKKKPKNLKFKIICTFDRRDAPAYYDELMSKIEKENLDNIIVFTGHIPQNEINKYYASADYMIYTTLCESFGFSMIEAKTFRLPALCSDIPINREIAKKSARYYPPENSYALADAIMEFVKNRPDDFDFNDDLINWDWQKYTSSLIKIIEKVSK